MKLRFGVPFPIKKNRRSSRSVMSADDSESYSYSRRSFADEDSPALVSIRINGDNIFENIGASIDAGIDEVGERVQDPPRHLLSFALHFFFWTAKLDKIFENIAELTDRGIEAVESFDAKEIADDSSLKVKETFESISTNAQKTFEPVRGLIQPAPQALVDEDAADVDFVTVAILPKETSETTNEYVEETAEKTAEATAPDVDDLFEAEKFIVAEQSNNIETDIVETDKQIAEKAAIIARLQMEQAYLEVLDKRTKTIINPFAISKARKAETNKAKMEYLELARLVRFVLVTVCGYNFAHSVNVLFYPEKKREEERKQAELLRSVEWARESERLEEPTNGGSKNDEDLLETNPNALKTLANEELPMGILRPWQSYWNWKRGEETSEITKETPEAKAEATAETTATTEENSKEEKVSKDKEETAKTADETPNVFINAFKTFFGESFPTFGEDEEAAFKRANDAVDETVNNIDERVKIIAETEGFKDTKSMDGEAEKFIGGEEPKNPKKVIVVTDKQIAEKTAINVRPQQEQAHLEIPDKRTKTKINPFSKRSKAREAKKNRAKMENLELPRPVRFVLAIDCGHNFAHPCQRTLLSREETRGGTEACRAAPIRRAGQ